MEKKQSLKEFEQTAKALGYDKEKLQAFIEIFDKVLGAVREPLVVLDSDLKVVKANHSFYQTFKVKPEGTEGVLIYDLGSRQWDIPKLRELLEDVLPQNTTFNDFEVEHDFETIGRKIMYLNARRIYTESKQTQMILLAIEDVTEREYYKRHLEELVEKRTVEISEAREEAEKGKQIAEAALLEIKELKDQLEAERAYLQEEIKLKYNHENIIGQSDGINYVLYKVEQIARSNTIVLVLGETGTGKELVARAIHGLSLRKERALVKLDCATLPSNLIESELFGHERGAFTGAHSRKLGRFEVADGATLFLDEIGELPLELQPKLLRVVQDGEFERLGGSRTIKIDVRIIAATNRNLEEEVRSGRFRDDLWYRLNIFPITVPPLRDRVDDIPLLAGFYVNKISKRMGKSIEIIPTRVMNALQNYHWPGNVRELENVLERAVINSSGPKLRLVDELKKPQKNLSTAQKTLEAVERDHIVRILEQTQWKISGKNGAAEILGLNRSTLRARMRKLGILRP
ncbi:MAG: sigma 54-interacting transcriptional regulator [Deltaproteobacteria bacterium]|nr:sigma 54-interacting transcriptional regulator [Deltaproteobacteria bacterium]MBW1954351.1 sigma 54-interacting transcriptional regulator [Deltaproteobacteria bacterium]MBW2040879.1 sigma 54-interacting transcriptional regulator [Deltaproteobacteria bacterium]MBW2132045.1 sigma 54-interacting transcriptional regulator [Deltaproteobacteria bacterium]